MKQTNKNLRKTGFTLVEVLVAMAIFSTVMVAALSIFVRTQTLQQRTLASQRGQSDARYALELMSRKIRLGEIDYEYYVSNSINLNNSTSILALRDSNGLPVRFQLTSGVIQLCSSFNQTNLNTSTNLSESCDAWVNITPNNITIIRLSFYISPSQDPFLLNTQTGEYYGGDQQAIVTIILESSVTQTKGGNYPTHFQTTVSSRVYKR